MNHRSNGFDALRLLAAALVIFGHAYPLTGNIAPGLLANGIQTVGVKIFFVISGYLITKSWQSDPNLIRFWLKRFLRLMPGLACLCLVTVLIVGPCFTTLGLTAYLRNPSTSFYFWNLLLYPVYTLPGVFQGNIYGPAVNGSLWSLPVEVAMYVGVPILAGRYPRLARFTVPAFAAGLLVASILFVRLHPPAVPTVIWGSSLTSTLDAAFYFYIGSVVAVYRLEYLANLPASLALFGTAAVSVHDHLWGEVAMAATLPWLVISIGKLQISSLHAMLKGRDYSYGLYLYGFLVQQSVIHLFGFMTPLVNAAVSLPLTLLCAMGSWH